MKIASVPTVLLLSSIALGLFPSYAQAAFDTPQIVQEADQKVEQRLLQLQGEIQEQRNKYEEQQKQLREELKKAQEEIDKIRKQAPTTGLTAEQLKRIIDEDSKRIEKLEQLASNSFVNEVALDEKRYLAGFEILVKMIEASGFLQERNRFANSISEFGSLSNPMLIPEFKQQISKFIGESGQNDPNKELILPEAVANNPIITIGYSLVSLFTSKRKKEDKSKDAFNQILYVLNMAARAGDDERLLRSSLTDINKHAGEFDKTAQALFVSYLGALQSPDIPLTWEAYRNDHLGNEKIRRAAKSLFEKLSSSDPKLSGPNEVPMELKNIRYQVYEIDRMMMRYETVIIETDTVMAKFGATLESRLKEPGIEKLTEQKATISKLIETNKENRKGFTDNYLSPVIRWRGIIMSK